ncbi:hypothetical protein E2562_022940 [Oryza meyeriana var. granulata]|nr:hypothetical protein E2562_022940 [Oryza meyeriana var. granulata]KAF0908102.1 hypothetical protein E2562_022940 [Oryza meyeriana var. granulata]KAF0908105.1 hypothetical protein E2562_022940 [Oryza meyeriana var. granulata]KAF0908107.1 hypothetical protein E2562_022940 [Oryza meyeriana var. granulata]KAF0908108.1 hypothetical protein E2562_022940 [Oryza meyeriana var. granulata]
MASQSWVAERVVASLKKKPSIGAKELQQELQDKYKITIPYQTVWYGRQWAAEKLFGIWDDSFDWLYRFKAELGQAIGPTPRLTVYTDACKGLEAAVKKVFPWAEQRECFRHLMENMKKYHGPVYGNMWPPARAYKLDRFHFYFNKVLEANADVADWLDKYHNLLWARCKFSCEIKCDYITNNLAESWNNWIKDYKDLPVDVLADATREKTLVLFENRRRIAQRLPGVILPVVVHQLNAASKGLGHLKVIKGGNESAEVTELYKDVEVIRHVVYLDKNVPA